MKIQLLAAVSLMIPMLAVMPVHAAPQTMADGSTFDSEFYAQNNPDVVAVFGNDATSLYNHYVLCGKAEGRAAYAGDTEAVTILTANIANGTAIVSADAATAQATAVAAAQAAVGTTATAANTEFEQYIQQILAQITTSDMSDSQKLNAAWNWLLKFASYKRTYETPSGDWTQQYAQELLSSGHGNCYRYAAAFAYLAKELGYDVKVVTGQISAARGGVTPHGWCVITIGGVEYICDPDMADAKGAYSAYYMKTFSQYPVKPLIAQNSWAINF